MAEPAPLPPPTPMEAERRAEDEAPLAAPPSNPVQAGARKALDVLAGLSGATQTQDAIDDPAPEAVSDIASGRVAFRIAFPQRQTDSWIGGCPAMPDAMEWPEIDGEPAVFLAQIALTDLPEDLWGERGQRRGWLLFFTGPDPSADGLVLQTWRRGTPRPIPDNAPIAFPPETPQAALAELIGPQAQHPPRWYLTPAPEDGGPRPDLVPGPRRLALLTGGKLSEPGLFPMDWATAFALLDGTLQAFDTARAGWQAKWQKTCTEKDRARLEAGTAATARALRDLAKQTEARAADTPFSEAECLRVMEGLLSLTNAAWQSTSALREGRKPRPLLTLPLFERYKAIAELQARRLYTEDPESLPERTAKALLPVWEEDAAREVVYVGNAPGDDLPNPWPCLLLLPSSDLTGVAFGEGTRWAVHVSPEDLEDGYFAEARAAIGEGKVWA